MTIRSSSRVVLGSIAFALAITFVAAWLLCVERGVPPVPQPTESSDGPVPVAQRSVWIQRLRAGGEVRFVEAGLDAENGPREVSKIRGLGCLVGPDLQTLEGLVGGLYDMRAATLARHRSEMREGDLPAAVKEASLALAVEVALVMRSMAKEGRYVVLSPGESLPPGAAEEVVTTGAEMDGKPVSVWFSVPCEEFPVVEQLRRYGESLRDSLVSDCITKFNSLPLGTRVQYHDRHVRLMGTATAKWTVEDTVFEREWFPPGVWIDEESTLMKDSRRR